MTSMKNLTRESETEHDLQINRRDFCRLMGGGLLVALVLPGKAPAQRAGRAGNGTAVPDAISAWIHIDGDGRITAFTGKMEGGQGSRTELAQVVAEELRVPFDSVQMVMGDTLLTPYDRGTFGSQTTPVMVPQLRRAAAAAREALIDLAAESWKVDRGKIQVQDGKVTDDSGKHSAKFAELTRGTALTRTIDASQPLTPVDKWTVAGKPIANANGTAIVTGTHKYPSDLRPEGMLYGHVLRAQSFGARLVSLDSSPASKPGIVIVHDGEFVGAAAPTHAEAFDAITELKPKWTTTPQPSQSGLFAYLKAHPAQERGFGGSSEDKAGDLAQGLAAAKTKLQASYTVAYIAHAPLETRAAVADWKDGKLTVWVGTQRPFGVRDELAQAFSLPPENVHVLTPDMGSGYGGKHSGDAAIEAARLAKAAGKPVKLVWSREEEFTWAYFRPAGVIDVSSGVDADGRLTAWDFQNWNSGGAGLGTPYEVANRSTAFHPTASPLRQGSYRALAATANNFARESHMDELAHAAGIDPVEFRIRNLKDDRLKAVLQAAAKEFGWSDRKKQKDRGYGIACAFEKGGRIATAVEMQTGDDPEQTKVVRAVTAFEAGAVINPDNIRNQIEGALIMGIGGALFESIQFEDGKILNAAFSKYRVPRFADVPRLVTIVLDRKDQPSAGAGECSILAVAPAIASAIFDATGKRFRDLPLLGPQASG